MINIMYLAEALVFMSHQFSLHVSKKIFINVILFLVKLPWQHFCSLVYYLCWKCEYFSNICLDITGISNPLLLALKKFKHIYSFNMVKLVHAQTICELTVVRMTLLMLSIIASTEMSVFITPSAKYCLLCHF